jgi:penicillin-insensitive murein endopeptidase
MAQPRGGPATFGHASHQNGLDVDIWYKAMPDRTLSVGERDKIPLESVLADPGHVNPQLWTAADAQLLRRAASYPTVERIFVHPAIKKALCDLPGEDRAYLRKLKPMWGHDDHFHVRLACPAGSTGCQRQPPVPDGDGCGKELDRWLKMVARVGPPPAIPKPDVAPTPPKGKRAIMLEQLPVLCQTVLSAAPADGIKHAGGPPSQ